MKNSTTKLIVGVFGAVVITVLVMALLFSGIGTQPQPQAIVPQVGTTTGGGTAGTGGGQAGTGTIQVQTCNSTTLPVVKLIANNKYSKANLADGSVDANVFVNGVSPPQKNTYSGLGSAYGATVIRDNAVKIWAGRTRTYNYEYITSIANGGTRNTALGYNVDCDPEVQIIGQFTPLGGLSNAITLQDGRVQDDTSGGGTVSSIVADISAASSNYTWRVRSTETIAYGSWGSESTTNKSIGTVDYNLSDFSIIELLQSNGTTAPIALAPPHIGLLRDGNANTQKAFYMPFLQVANGGFVDWSIRVTTTATFDPNQALIGQRRMMIHFSDLQPYYNSNSGAVEELAYDPIYSTDIGSIDTNVNFIYR